jgi:hypothetical protein
MDGAAGQRSSGAAYAKLAGLGLEIEGYRIERHELDVSSGFCRVTTEIVLAGGGLEGRGEDVTYAAEDHDGLDLVPGRPPQEEFFRAYRRWGFESAALDLALRQSRLSLGAALDRPYLPVRFVLSTRLDIKPWLAIDPRLEFKLDPTPEWDERLMREIAATDRVRQLDFKSFYQGSPVDNPPDPVQYRLVSEVFPGAVLEDPALEGPARDMLRGQEARFSFDAPIHSWADVEAVTAWVAAACGPSRDAFVLRHLNIKPSRFGSVRALLDCVERAQAAGMVLYGGGQFELGIGRDQVQALASLLYPDGPNDVAPREYHGAARPGVPPSPLTPLVAQGAGFGFAFEV